MLTQDDVWGLTEKERQTLRLMVRGHDAKSIARSLDLSIHTVNERLRDAAAR
jgi:DNA-binding CsgD family transcriptional regulator